MAKKTDKPPAKNPADPAKLPPAAWLRWAIELAERRSKAFPPWMLDQLREMATRLAWEQATVREQRRNRKARDPKSSGVMITVQPDGTSKSEPFGPPTNYLLALMQAKGKHFSPEEWAAIEAAGRKIAMEDYAKRKAERRGKAKRRR